MTHTLATFWDGARLAPLDQACLVSFVRHGFDVHVYSYGSIDNLHGDLQPRDAAEIVDQAYTTRFRIGGRPSLSHFSDLFRYRLFQRSDKAWIDTDLLCLRAFDIPPSGHFLTLETPKSLNGAISRLDRGHPELDGIVAEAERLAHENFRWGATGPRLITERLGHAALVSARAPADFYPFHWNDWFVPFLPEEAHRCEMATADSSAVHLWNNIVVKAGYWKDLAPPAGSFLHATLKRLDLLDLFEATLPSDVMQQIVRNFQNLQSGSHLTIAGLSKMLARRLATATTLRLRASPR